jgi:adenine nucleotide transporter 17
VLQTRQSKQDLPMWTLLQRLIQDEGIWALWKGMLASLILVANPIIQFVVYEWLKKKYSSGGKLRCIQDAS